MQNVRGKWKEWKSEECVFVWWSPTVWFTDTQHTSGTDSHSQNTSFSPFWKMSRSVWTHSLHLSVLPISACHAALASTRARQRAGRPPRTSATSTHTKFHPAGNTQDQSAKSQCTSSLWFCLGLVWYERHLNWRRHSIHGLESKVKT